MDTMQAGETQPFGRLLKCYREAVGLTQRQLAEQAGLSEKGISALEAARRQTPHRETIRLLALALKLSEQETARFERAATQGRQKPSYDGAARNDSATVASAPVASSAVSLRQDVGDMPATEGFCGRGVELATLTRWIIDDRCRVVAVLGSGGVGKTALTAQVVDQTTDTFDSVIWQSLLNAPPIENTLRKCMNVLSEQTLIDLPEDTDEQISLLIRYLRQYRCLLVLDNVEAILQGGDPAGHYRTDYAGYSRLIQRVAGSLHQSCILLTSRERPGGLVLQEGEASAARSLSLVGLGSTESRHLLKDQHLFGSDQAWADLILFYAGNPLALKLISAPIRELFAGKIDVFLQEGGFVFGDVHDLLAQQFGRLSELERDIMYWLAIEREPVSIDDLRDDLVRPTPRGELVGALDSLRARSLIEIAEGGAFTLQAVIMEYVTERLITQAVEDIVSGTSGVLNTHALIRAQAKEYVRQSQVRVILHHTADRLVAICGRGGLEHTLKGLLATLQANPSPHPGYLAGNILNLLVHLKYDLRGYDFARLTVRQAYLQGVDLPDVNLSGADLATSVFTSTFGRVLSVACSPNGKLLAAGTARGEIHVWHIPDGTLLLTLRGHAIWVRSVAFSPDGQLLASGSEDRTVRLWDVSSGQLLRTLVGHTHWVKSVAFSPDGQLLASGGDHTIRLWEVSSGQSLKVLTGHTDPVSSVVFSPDGRALASGSEDQTVRLWDVRNGEPLKVLTGHTHWVWSVAFSPDGQLLASGGGDHTIRLWEVSSGEPLRVLTGHTDRIRSIAFSPDGQLLASASDDRTVRLWEVSSGQPLRTLPGHTRWVWSVAFSPDGQLLASSSDDRTVRLWEVSSGQPLKILTGHTHWVWSVEFSPDGQLLASGSEDWTVRLWEVSSGQLLRTLPGYTKWVWSVALSPDGRVLASSSDDQTVRLWGVSSGQPLMVFTSHTDRIRSIAFSPDGQLLASGGDQAVRLWQVSSGHLLKVLTGHTDRVRSMAFSPDGQLLASTSDDQTIRLWEMSSGQPFKVLIGHTHWVWSVAFSPDSRVLASSGDEQTVRLWDVSRGECVRTLPGHTHWVRSVAFSPDGQLLASGGDDQTVRLWEVSSGQLLRTLVGHSHWVWSVAFSPDGQLLASSSEDGTIKLWDVQKGQCLRTLRSDRPYERMNITSATGLTETQREALRALGAIEDPG
jgi:WD40 repeat protein/transcriptional regulator with XRE-family HTH domain